MRKVITTKDSFIERSRGMGPGVRRDDVFVLRPFLVELAVDELGDGGERGLGLGADRGDHDRGAGPAASIIKPMIERPPTVSLPRVTQTSALKRSTVWTNFAEARACRPRLLTIRSSGRRRPKARSGRFVLVRRLVAHLPARTRLAMVTYLRPASWAIGDRVGQRPLCRGPWPA